MPAENFLPQHAYGVYEAARLTWTAKAPAEHATFGLMSAENWQIRRFTAQLVVDEQDLVDGSPIGLKLRLFEALGQAAARVVPDMVFSLLLQNPMLTADNNALFSAPHNNYATGSGSALGDASIDAGSAAIGNQVAPDGRGDAVHLNLSGRYLITPPQLYGPARRSARLRQMMSSGDLIVRSESRLGPQGVVDPVSDTVIAGSATNWLMVAPADQAPSILVGALDGSTDENGKIAPTIRQSALGPSAGSPGQWGLCLDVLLDLGVSALDWRGIYFSAGQ
jgi:hypothetical protein